MTRLSRWMIKKSITTTTLAYNLGATVQSVNAWRRGDYAPDLHFALAIVKYSGGDLQPIDLLVKPTTKKKA